MSRLATCAVFSGLLLCFTGLSSAATVIEAATAAIRTEGGSNPGGGWNLWSNGRVGQPLRFATVGTYSIVVRAWGTGSLQDTG